MVYRRRRLKEKKNSIAVPLFIIAIMVLSVVGYSLLQGGNNESNEYNGFKFRTVNNYYVTKINKEDIIFYFNPNEVQNIPTENIPELPSYVYLTSNPDADYSQQELMTIDLAKFEMKNTLPILGYSPQIGFSDQITCKNASSSIGVIDLDLGNETSIKAEGNCIKITGTNAAEVVASRDKVIMILAGILE